VKVNKVIGDKMNILLALMSLDIGGAETHVVTLAKALNKKVILW